MKFRLRTPNANLLLLAIALVAAFAIILAQALDNTVQALPEYTHRTGEPCGTCHVSPGGGGPRTMRGLLWTAKGRPDAVPVLGDVLIAPGVEDPEILYAAACAACHGRSGEGALAATLIRYPLTESLVRYSVTNGLPRLEMPSFAGRFTEEQITALAQYVVLLNSGYVIPANGYPLAPPRLGCTSVSKVPACGGN